MIIRALAFFVFLSHFGTYSLTTPPVWVTSNLVQASSANVIATKTGSSSQPKYNFTFGFAFSGTPHLGYGIKSYEGFDYLGQEMFQVNRTYLDNTKFSVAVQILQITNILIMNVPYIAIDPSFPHHLNSFDNVPVNYSAGPIVNISTVSTTQTQTYTNIVNYTLQSSANIYKTFLTPYSRNKILLFMTSLFFFGSVEALSSQTLYPITFRVTAQAISATEYKLFVSLRINVRITKLHFSMVIFDEEDVSSSGKYQLVYQQIQVTKLGTFIPIPIEFVGNFIMGLIDFNTTRTASIMDFQWNFATVNGTYGIYMIESIGQTNMDKGTTVVQQLAFTMLYMKTWYCPTGYLFVSPLSICQTCNLSQCLTCQTYDTCQTCNATNGFFLDQNLTCQPIMNFCTLTGCLNCTDAFTCGICDTANGYALSGGSCYYCNQSLNNFLNSSSSLCQACSIPNCITCQSLTQCLVCDNNTSHYLSPITNTCQYCNNTDNKFLNSTTLLCQTCMLQGCVLCSSPTQCSVCDNSSYIINMTSLICQTLPPLPAVPVCGNGIGEIGEECDDGNTVDYDGCSASCEEEEGYYHSCNYFSCSSLVFVPQDQCSKLEREQCNGFRLKFRHTVIRGLTGVELSFFDFVNEGLQIVSKSHIDDCVTVDVKFNRDIQGQLLLLKINSDDEVASFEVKGPVPALYYDQTECKAFGNSKSLFVSILVLSYLVLLFSLFSGKIVGLQLFGVLQLAYFSISFHDYFNIYLNSISLLKISNGLNLPLQEQYNSVLPEKLSYLNVYSSFINNCNVMLLLFFLEGFVALMLYLIFKVTKNRKLSKISSRMLKQGFITMVMFNVLNIAFSAGIHFRYANQTSSNFIFSGALATISIIAIAISVIAIQICSEKGYGEFKQKFKNNFICRLYIALQIGYRFFLGLYLAVKNDYPQATLIILSITIIYLIYLATNLPFSNYIHNYRSFLIHLTQLIILFNCNYYRLMKSTTPIQIKSHIHTPILLEIVAICLCIGVSFVMVLHAVVGEIRGLYGRIKGRKIQPKVGSGVGVGEERQATQEGVKNIQNQTIQNIFGLSRQEQ